MGKRRANVSYSMCNFCGAMTAENGLFFYEELYFTMKHFKFSEAGWVGLNNFGPKYQKAHLYTNMVD